jgi:hypothetical protein
MLAQHLQRLDLEMYGYRVINQRIKHRIHQKRDKGDVIQMPVCKEYVAYPAQRIQREITRTGTAVNQDIVIDQ